MFFRDDPDRARGCFAYIVGTLTSTTMLYLFLVAAAFFSDWAFLESDIRSEIQAHVKQQLAEMIPSITTDDLKDLPISVELDESQGDTYEGSVTVRRDGRILAFPVQVEILHRPNRWALIFDGEIEFKTEFGFPATGFPSE